MKDETQEIGLADRLRRLREDLKGLTYRGFAERVNEELPAGKSISHVTFSNWEKSDYPRPGPDEVQAILDAFPDVRIEWLMFGEGAPTASKEEIERKLASRDPLVQKLEQEHPKIRGFDRGTKEVFLAVLREYVQTAPDAKELDETEEGHETLVRLAGNLLLPVKLFTEGAWGFRTAAEDSRTYQKFVRSLLTALSLQMREEGDGSTTENAPGHLTDVLEAHEKRLSAAREALSESAEG